MKRILSYKPECKGHFWKKGPRFFLICISIKISDVRVRSINIEPHWSHLCLLLLWSCILILLLAASCCFGSFLVFELYFAAAAAAASAAILRLYIGKTSKQANQINSISVYSVRTWKLFFGPSKREDPVVFLPLRITIGHFYCPVSLRRIHLQQSSTPPRLFMRSWVNGGDGLMLSSSLKIKTILASTWKSGEEEMMIKHI